MAADYPPQLSPESVAVVIDVIRTQNYSRKAEFLRHGWWLQGSLQKIIFGDGQAPEALSEEVTISEAQFVKGLEKLCGHEDSPQEFLDNIFVQQILAFLVAEILKRLAPKPKVV